MHMVECEYVYYCFYMKTLYVTSVVASVILYIIVLWFCVYICIISKWIQPAGC